MTHFCTLFDANFISYGLALYESLDKKCKDFCLYVVAFDDTCYQLLTTMDLPKMKVISLSDFENEELLRIKPGRSRAEYCWTSTPAVIKYCISKFDLPHCIYIDADLYFYSDPEQLIAEAGEKSVIITPHWYYPKWDTGTQTGIYCVQFMYFRNTTAGLQVLNWWYDRCIEWCFNRIEDGKFGDQKYLDDWTTRFQDVHVLQHRGGGVAPWNSLNYTFKFSEKPALQYKEKEYPVVFYHFHGLRFSVVNDEEIVNLGNYKLNKAVVNHIYQPYIKRIVSKNALLKEMGFQVAIAGTSALKNSMTIKEKIIKLLTGSYNVYKLKNLIS